MDAASAEAVRTVFLMELGERNDELTVIEIWKCKGERAPSVERLGGEAVEVLRPNDALDGRRRPAARRRGRERSVRLLRALLDPCAGALEERCPDLAALLRAQVRVRDREAEPAEERRVDGANPVRGEYQHPRVVLEETEKYGDLRARDVNVGVCGG